MTKIAALALVAFVTCFASIAQANPMRDLAPADEYFGRLRMSVLGIRNELVTLERRCENGDSVAALNGKLAMVDDAMRDWRSRYPHDTWLPRYEAQRARIADMIGFDVIRR